MKRFLNKIFNHPMFGSLTSKHIGSKLRKLAPAVLVVLVMAVIMAMPIHRVAGYEAPFKDVGKIDVNPGDLIVGGIGYSVAWILDKAILIPEGWLLGAAGTFADWMLQPTAIVNATVVQIGWGITRDFANMFFILILLAIALDFILFQSFGVKRALPTLIIVALLINFSLPIAGVLIDFSNVFTHFFMGKISANCGPDLGLKECGFTVAIAQNLNVTNLLDVKVSMITDILFAIFFMAGTIFIFFAMGIMFLYRTAYLYALLIILPMVLVLLPFPKTSKYFSQWSNNFFKWTMFAPAASFFLYLSMIVFQANVGSNAAQEIFQGAGKGTSGAIITQVMKYIIVWFFMLGSLMIAQQMGINGAGAAMGMMSSAKKWATGKVKGAGKQLAGAGARRAKTDEKLDKAAEMANKIPLVGKFAARGLRKASVKTEQAIKQQGELTAQEKASYEKYSPAQLMAEYKNRAKSILPYERGKAGKIASILAQKGQLVVRDPDTGEIIVGDTDKLVREAHGFAKQYNDKDSIKNILRSRPTIARDIIRENWEKDDKENKVAGAFYDIATKRLTQGTNKKTGLKLEDALNSVFDMTTAEFENLKGTWEPEVVRAFLESGKLGRGFIQKASDIGETHFIEHIEKYLETLTGIEKRKEKERLINKNPWLKSKGNISDFITIPPIYREKNKESDETSSVD